PDSFLTPAGRASPSAHHRGEALESTLTTNSPIFQLIIYNCRLGQTDHAVDCLSLISHFSFLISQFALPTLFIEHCVADLLDVFDIVRDAVGEGHDQFAFAAVLDGVLDGVA